MGLGMACYWLSGWAFLEVLEYFGILSVLFAAVSYFPRVRTGLSKSITRLGRSSTPHKEKEAVAEGLMPWRNSMRTACRCWALMSAAHSSKTLISAEQTCSERTFERPTCEVGILTARRCNMQTWHLQICAMPIFETPTRETRLCRTLDSSKS